MPNFEVTDLKKVSFDIVVKSEYMRALNRRSLPAKWQFKIAKHEVLVCVSKSKTRRFCELVAFDGTFLLQAMCAIKDAPQTFVAMLNARMRGNEALLDNCMLSLKNSLAKYE